MIYKRLAPLVALLSFCAVAVAQEPSGEPVSTNVVRKELANGTIVEYEYVYYYDDEVDGVNSVDFEDDDIEVPSTTTTTTTTTTEAPRRVALPTQDVRTNEVTEGSRFRGGVNSRRPPARASFSSARTARPAEAAPEPAQQPSVVPTSSGSGRFFGGRGRGRRPSLSVTTQEEQQQQLQTAAVSGRRRGSRGRGRTSSASAQPAVPAPVAPTSTSSSSSRRRGGGRSRTTSSSSTASAARGGSRQAASTTDTASRNIEQDLLDSILAAGGRPLSPEEVANLGKTGSGGGRGRGRSSSSSSRARGRQSSSSSSSASSSRSRGRGRQSTSVQTETESSQQVQAAGSFGRLGRNFGRGGAGRSPQSVTDTPTVESPRLPAQTRFPPRDITTAVPEPDTASPPQLGERNLFALSRVVEQTTPSGTPSQQVLSTLEQVSTTQAGIIDEAVTEQTSETFTEAGSTEVPPAVPLSSIDFTALRERPVTIIKLTPEPPVETTTEPEIAAAPTTSPAATLPARRPPRIRLGGRRPRPSLSRGSAEPETSEETAGVTRGPPSRRGRPRPKPRRPVSEPEAVQEEQTTQQEAPATGSRRLGGSRGRRPRPRLGRPRIGGSRPTAEAANAAETETHVSDDTAAEVSATPELSTPAPRRHPGSGRRRRPPPRLGRPGRRPSLKAPQPNPEPVALNEVQEVDEAQTVSKAQAVSQVQTTSEETISENTLDEAAVPTEVPSRRFGGRRRPAGRAGRRRPGSRQPAAVEATEESASGDAASDESQEKPAPTRRGGQRFRPKATIRGRGRASGPRRSHRPSPAQRVAEEPLQVEASAAPVPEQTSGVAVDIAKVVTDAEIAVTEAVDAAAEIIEPAAEAATDGEIATETTAAAPTTTEPEAETSTESVSPPAGRRRGLPGRRGSRPPLRAGRRSRPGRPSKTQPEEQVKEETTAEEAVEEEAPTPAPAPRTRGRRPSGRRPSSSRRTLGRRGHAAAAAEKKKAADANSIPDDTVDQSRPRGRLSLGRSSRRRGGRPTVAATPAPPATVIEETEATPAESGAAIEEDAAKITEVVTEIEEVAVEEPAAPVEKPAGRSRSLFGGRGGRRPGSSARSSRRRVSASSTKAEETEDHGEEAAIPPPRERLAFGRSSGRRNRPRGFLARPSSADSGAASTEEAEADAANSASRGEALAVELAQGRANRRSFLPATSAPAAEETVAQVAADSEDVVVVPAPVTPVAASSGPLRFRQRTTGGRSRDRNVPPVLRGRSVGSRAGARRSLFSRLPQPDLAPGPVEEVEIQTVTVPTEASVTEPVTEVVEIVEGSGTPAEETSSDAAIVEEQLVESVTEQEPEVTTTAPEPAQTRGRPRGRAGRRPRPTRLGRTGRLSLSEKLAQKAEA